MLVWPSGWISPTAPCRSPTWPSGWVRTTQCACWSNATTPISSRDVIAAAARGSPPCRCRPCGRRRSRTRAARPAALERVAVAGVHRARLVDDDDERDVGLLLAAADAHVDRQRLLDRRLLVAAGAVGVRAADHDEALAQVAHEDLEGQHLAIGQRCPRDVDEDDRVVLGEDQRVAREALGRDRVDVLALGLERADQLRGDGLVAGDDQRPRLALDDRVGVGPVVLAERVQGGLDDDAEPDEAGLVGLDPERDVGRALLEVDALDAAWTPFAKRRTVAGWAVVERIWAVTSISSPSATSTGP